MLSALLLVLCLLGARATTQPEAANPPDYFSRAQIEEATRFNRNLYILFLSKQAALISFLGLISFSRLALSYERDIAKLCFNKKRLVLPLYIFFVLLMVRLVVLPFDAVRDLLVKRTFGLTTQGAGGWLADQAKQFISADLWFIPLALFIFATMRRLRRTWWLVSAAALGAALTAWYSLAPYLVEPLFYRLTPVRSESLRSRLDPLFEKAGIERPALYEADSGKKTTEVNAYASGLFLGKRIVLYDVLTEEADPSEIEFVVAHEIGHWKKNHILKGIGIATAGAALVFYLLGRLLRLSIPKSRPGDGGRYPPSSVPLFFFWLYVLVFFTMPVESTISRRFETAADKYALELTQNPEAAIQLFREAARKNLLDLDPPPLAKLWLHTHPTIPERIRAATSVMNKPKTILKSRQPAALPAKPTSTP